MKNVKSKVKAENRKFNFKSGDTVKVYLKVVEGSNERIQGFDGVVIAEKGSGQTETFTVRKISSGVGVERIFPLHSPRITNIEVLKRGKVRRAKIYYLRNLSGKAAKLKEIKKVDAGKKAKKKPAETAPVASAEVKQQESPADSAETK